MASTSGCTQQLKDVILSDTCGTMGGSSDQSEYLTAPANGSEHGTPSSSSFAPALGGSIVGGTESGLEMCNGVTIEEQIEQSKSHWSLLADQSDCIDEEQVRPRGIWQKLMVGFGIRRVAEVDNVLVFKALQMHPTWGDFFQTFGYDLGGRYGSNGSLVVGEKFAEGGQAELFHAHVTWSDPKDNEWCRENRVEWVVKVFKKGTFLRHLQKQLPHGYLQFYAQKMERWKSPKPKLFPRYYCVVERGTLLKDGRFAFLMMKEHFDLHTLIERNMKLRSGEGCGPFSKEDAELIMYRLALGVDWLHSHDIIHRDLKASNVLITEFKGWWPKWNCFIADYECSIGVVGTGFFRAPEILQACKERKLSQRPEVFTKAVDVYSYGMTCYEILTGKLPFEGHLPNDYDLVLNGQRPMIPEYVEDWLHRLLNRCWQFNPMARPTLEEILSLFLEHSSRIRDYAEWSNQQFGQV